MSDAESLLRAQDGAEPLERHRLLSQIAVALDLPVAAFTEDRSPGETSAASSAECAALLDAFTRIRDARLRASCLRLLRSFSQP